MPVIRELITLFGFEVDEKGANNVEKRVDGMKRGIGGLGKLLGVSLGIAGARAMFKIGQSAARAEFNMSRLADLSFEDLKTQFKGIQAELDIIKKGAGEVITKEQFDVAGASFFRVFGKGAAQLKTFNQLFTFAAKQAAITGQSVVDIFSEIQSGVQGGGFEGLLDIPGFDIFRKQLKEAHLELLDPGEIGGRIGLENRLAFVIGIITEATEEQNTALEKVPENLFEMDKASAKTEDSFKKLAATINSLLVPAMEGLNSAIDSFNQLVEIGQQAKTPTGAAKAIARAVIPETDTEGTAKTLIGQMLRFSFGNKELDPDAYLAAPGLGRFLGNQPPPEPRGDTINVTNHIEIKSTDPREAGKEAVRAMQKTISSAKRSIIKTEE
jgi:hypothetical protein